MTSKLNSNNIHWQSRTIPSTSTGKYLVLSDESSPIFKPSFRAEYFFKTNKVKIYNESGGLTICGFYWSDYSFVLGTTYTETLEQCIFELLRMIEEYSRLFNIDIPSKIEIDNSL